MPTSTVENTATIRRSFLPMVSLFSIATCSSLGFVSFPDFVSLLLRNG